jgi:hypothetical protein
LAAKAQKGFDRKKEKTVCKKHHKVTDNLYRTFLGKDDELTLRPFVQLLF